MQKFNVGGVIERPFELSILAENEEEAEKRAEATIKSALGYTDENLEDNEPLIYIEYVEPEDDPFEE